MGNSLTKQSCTGPTLGQCWSTVYDSGPTPTRHWGYAVTYSERFDLLREDSYFFGLHLILLEKNEAERGHRPRGQRVQIDTKPVVSLLGSRVAEFIVVSKDID